MENKKNSKAVEETNGVESTENETVVETKVVEEANVSSESVVTEEQKTVNINNNGNLNNMNGPTRFQERNGNNNNFNNNNNNNNNNNSSRFEARIPHAMSGNNNNKAKNDKIILIIIGCVFGFFVLLFIVASIFLSVFRGYIFDEFVSYNDFGMNDNFEDDYYYDDGCNCGNRGGNEYYTDGESYYDQEFVSVSVNNVSDYTSENESAKPKEGYKFVLVDFTVKNISDGMTYLHSDDDFTLITDLDTYEVSRESRSLDTDDFAENLFDGEKGKYSLVFEIPTDEEITYFRYDDGDFNVQVRIK